MQNRHFDVKDGGQVPLGTVELILGPMFAGKTEELLRRRNVYLRAKKSTLLVKFKGDTRYDAKEVVSHSQIKAPSDYQVARLRDLPEEAWRGREAILIEEGQFFPDLAEFVTTVRFSQNCDIIIAALNGTSQQKPWPSISELLPFQPKITWLQAVCEGCPYAQQQPAASAAYTVDHAGVIRQGDIQIGGADLYRSVCGMCLREHYALKQVIDGLTKQAPR